MAESGALPWTQGQPKLHSKILSGKQASQLAGKQATFRTSREKRKRKSQARCSKCSVGILFACGWVGKSPKKGLETPAGFRPDVGCCWGEVCMLSSVVKLLGKDSREDSWPSCSCRLGSSSSHHVPGQSCHSQMAVMLRLCGATEYMKAVFCFVP